MQFCGSVLLKNYQPGYGQELLNTLQDQYPGYQFSIPTQIGESVAGNPTLLVSGDDASDFIEFDRLSEAAVGRSDRQSALAVRQAGQQLVPVLQRLKTEAARAGRTVTIQNGRNGTVSEPELQRIVQHLDLNG